MPVIGDHTAKTQNRNPKTHPSTYRTVHLGGKPCQETTEYERTQTDPGELADEFLECQDALVQPSDEPG